MRILFILIMALFFINGCSTNIIISNESDERKKKYDGQLLNIGVLGEKPNHNFDNIAFHMTTSDSLKQWEQEKYDAYFVTEPYFKELSRNEWKSVFKNIRIPVFFINLNTEAFIYRAEDMHYNEYSPKALSHTQGFVRTNNGYKHWEYGRPMESTNVNDTPEWVFHSIFKDIEEYLIKQFN